MNSEKVESWHGIFFILLERYVRFDNVPVFLGALVPLGLFSQDYKD